MKLPDISKMRGMSEPRFYAFNTLKDSGLLAHGVVFTSLILHGSATAKLFEPDDDPRMAHFIGYVKTNTLKDDYDLINRYQAKMLRLCDAFNILCKSHGKLSEQKIREELEELGKLIDRVKAQIAAIELNK